MTIVYEVVDMHLRWIGRVQVQKFRKLKYYGVFLKMFIIIRLSIHLKLWWFVSFAIREVKNVVRIKGCKCKCVNILCDWLILVMFWVDNDIYECITK